MEYIHWINAHWLEIVAALGALHGIASAITSLTPTPRDDEALAKIYKAVETVALVVGKAKQTPPHK